MHEEDTMLVEAPGPSEGSEEDDRTRLIKGTTFAAISVLFVSMQPIVANSRPPVLDAYLFAAMTVIIEALVFLPVVVLERRRLKGMVALGDTSVRTEARLNGWKKHKGFLLYIGLNFGIAQILFFLAYQYAGAINGSLAQQTSIIFAILFGFLINHERVTLKQVVFSGLLFFGLFIAITQGSFNLLEFNAGVLIMLVVVTIWMIAHAVSKRVFKKNEITSIQLVFLRNTLSGLILFSTYFLFFPAENLGLLVQPVNVFFYVVMGVVYAVDVFFWYSSLNYIDLAKATVIVSPMPIVTALFAFFLLGEVFTVYHLIGTIIIIVSIIMIVRERPFPKENKD